MYDIQLEDVTSGTTDTSLGAEEGARLHKRAYQILRGLVRYHIDLQAEPILRESSKPTGGYAVVEAQGGVLGDIIAENAEFVRQAQEIETQLQADQEFTPQDENLAENFSEDDEEVEGGEQV